MEAREVNDRIRRLLDTLGAFAIDPGRLSDHDDLYVAGLKSLGAMRLMLAVEREFDIELPEAILHRNLFSTVAHIGAAVVRLTQECSPASSTPS